ncbi:3-hydroxyacyl-CoA dehydratase 1 isoform X2 [Oratosquilla oratoria]|uniref:3-hydroxyacyl-CoA dehydratase 1 isoform X2 n=1 Tax=Oratosquilla oratoria TaxID=337810 RepID=UPI003F7675C7
MKIHFLFRWLIILIQTLNHLVDQHEVKRLWITTHSVLKIFQTLAILEIFHCAVGIVPSSAVLTAFQVFSRVFILWPVLNRFPDSQASIGYPMLLIAWSVTEIIRYSYYFLNILSCVPETLTFLRYTLFIGLYPLGVTGELLCAYAGLPEAAKSRPFSVKMPNLVNFTFDFYYALIVIMFLYIPIFPQLYLHMFAQRRKILGGGSKKMD